MKTKKIKVQAKELLEADIQHISLVPHGANRAPIKIIKSEEVDPKMKTHNIFKSEIETHVAAVRVTKGDNYEATRKTLEKCGFETMFQEEHEDHVKFLQKTEDDFDDIDTEDFELKLNEDVTFVLTTKAADFSNLNSTFADAIKKAQFFPMLGASLDAIHDVVVTNVTMPEQIDKSNIQKSLEDFSKHVMVLVDGLPEMVMKAEQAFRKGGAGSTDQLEHSEQEENTEVDEKAKAEAEAAKAKEKEEADANAAKEKADAEAAAGEKESESEEGKGGEGEAAASEEGEESESEEEGEGKDEVAKLLKSISDKIDNLSTRQDQIEKDVKKASESASEAVEKASTVARKVKGFVKSNQVDEEGANGKSRTRKSENPFSEMDKVFLGG